MSRQSVAPQRTLTLTEELERLEQSITLTLQGTPLLPPTMPQEIPTNVRPEIDHNFSRAHRIVTSSIIPVVQDYAKHSDAVWEGSKFWKQFFEASANVSLSSYEEPQDGDLTALGQEQEQAAEGQDGYGTPVQATAEDSVTTTEERPSNRFEDDVEASSILDSPSVTVASRSTPKLQQKQRQGPVKSHQPPTAASHAREASFAEYPSPYETLKAEMKASQRPQQHPARTAPTTPGRTTQHADETPEPSPALLPPSTARAPNTARQNGDPLLHRVLDRNYRVQATPHTSRKTSRTHDTTQPLTATQTRTQVTRNLALDSSPFSPAPAAPQLRAEIFGSPVARGRTGAGTARGERDRAGAAPRTPGMSVQHRTQRTPGLASARKTLFPSAAKGHAQTHAQGQARGDGTVFDEDSLLDSDTEDLDLGMSPPKTMQFHVPASRVVQTPAREASRRIVEDLLMSAGVPESLDGGGEGEDDELDLTVEEGYAEEDSPSVVRVRRGVGGEEDF